MGGGSSSSLRQEDKKSDKHIVIATRGKYLKLLKFVIGAVN